jgi:hypothetical protein
MEHPRGVARAQAQRLPAMAMMAIVAKSEIETWLAQFGSPA